MTDMMFSSVHRGVSDELVISAKNGTGLSAHGAQVAPFGRPIDTVLCNV
jgi:hypothetical protein